MPKHWSEVLGCACGMRFRSYGAEARHRHNFPLLCKQPKKRVVKCHERDNETTPIMEESK